MVHGEGKSKARSQSAIFGVTLFERMRDYPL